MKKKYLVFPGYVQSSADMQRHYIAAGHLMQLYGVKQSDCIIVTDRMRYDEVDALKKRHPDIISLHVDHRGNYKLPKGKSNAI